MLQKKSFVYFLSIVVLMMLSACASQNLFKSEMASSNEFFNYNPHIQYVIKKDDKVMISIWNHDDLSVGSLYNSAYNSNEVYGKWLMVNDSGNIYIPKFGDFKIEGLTIAQAETALKDLYKKIIVDPILDVRILNREVVVMGEVKTAGKQILEKQNNTLLDVIGKAGDFDIYANRKKIKVIRKFGNKIKYVKINLTEIDSTFSQNIQIYPGDVVYVPSRGMKAWERNSTSIIYPLSAIISSYVLLRSIKK
jgi:polysaccharide biosynthesis/export protein